MLADLALNMYRIIHLKFCITWQVAFDAYLHSGVLGFSYKMIFCAAWVFPCT